MGSWDHEILRGVRRAMYQCFCIFLYSFLSTTLFSIVCSVLCGWIWNIRVLLTKLRSYHPCLAAGNKSCNNAWRPTFTSPLGTSLRSIPKLRRAPFAVDMPVYATHPDEPAQKGGGAWSSIVIHGKSQHATSTNRQGIHWGCKEHATSTSRQGIYWGCKEHATSTGRQGIYSGCKEHATSISR